MNEKEICLRLQEQLCAFIKHVSINFPGDDAQMHQFIQRMLITMSEEERNRLKRFLKLYNYMLKVPGQSIISKPWCDKRVLKAKSFIENNYGNELRLAKIAVNVGLTEATLSRLFHKYLSITFTNYVINYRVNKSLNLLLESDNNIDEIACQCGFNSIRDFRRTFRKIQGTSPGILRKESRTLPNHSFMI